MKTKLLLSFSLFSFIGFAQAPVTSFYGTNNSHFAVMEPTIPIDQSASGANLTWNFNNMTVTDESFDTETVPTAAELSDFPGSTKVVTTTTIGTSSETKFYSKFPANVLSFTGASNAGVLLNYNTNNATLGTFPLEYGYNNSDVLAGNYDNGDYAGTFTGTITTTVDAYGTLNLGSGGVTNVTTTATRLKTVQNISLNYLIFTGIGTITLTTYSYYGADTPPGVPRFRTTETTIVVPQLSLNETFSTMEAYTITLGRTQNIAASAVVIAPNPMENVLNIQNGNQQIKSVSIVDVTGKIVLTDNSQNTNIDVSHLQPGIYFATIATDLGTSTKKIIKK